MSIEYNFDKELYMHGWCQYFAIQVAEMFHGKVCLWLDLDYNLNEDFPVTVLCHAYAKIADGLYVDAYGPFHSISEREDEFEYNEMNIVEYDIEEAKKVLKELKIPFSNVEMKKNAREYLRNNMMTFEVLYDNGYYNLGLCGRECEGKECGSFDYVLLKSYNLNNNARNGFDNKTYKIYTNLFIKGITKSFGFLPNKNWYYKNNK